MKFSTKISCYSILPLLLLLAPAVNTAGPPLIDFETYPDGTPACSRCPVTDEFAGRGVVFSFTSTFTNSTAALLFDSSRIYDPAGGPINHSVTAAGTGARGFASGTVSMHFAGFPKSVRFQARGNNLIAAFPVSAFYRDSNPVPETQITRSDISNYIPAGTKQPFRQETVTITWPGGISSVDVAMKGFIVLIDNLQLQ